MNTDRPVVRDERTVAVENASYRWSSVFLTYALLIDVMYRGAVRNEAAWDLMAMVVISGAVCMVYQARQQTLAHGWARKATLVGLVAGVIAAIVAVVMTMTRAT